MTGGFAYFVQTQMVLEPICTRSTLPFPGSGIDVALSVGGDGARDIVAAAGEGLGIEKSLGREEAAEAACHTQWDCKERQDFWRDAVTR